MKIKILHLLFCIGCIFFLFSQRADAQVTSANMTGYVLEDSSKGLPGAIVRATHLPSGTVYGAATEDDGSFNIQNMRVGGPYRVEVSFTGVRSQAQENIYLNIGETYQVTFRAVPDEKELKEIQVTASRDNIINSQRTGAETVINSYQMSVLPSIGRSISDFTSLTPQGNGSNFMGRDSRYNNFQLNGANFNNSFGLSSGLPGGSQPFPLDAIEQIQVAISPYDVRQSYFTGASVNMATRSGTNDFTGSAYTYWRNETYNGNRVGSVSLPPQTTQKNNIYGVRFGGPIIKNKLFFFVSAEMEKNVHPGINPDWIASVNTVTGSNISTVPADSLQKVSDFVKNKYSYNTGAYQNYANNFTNNYKRVLLRLDYNINEKNKINFTLTQFTGLSDQTPNSSSAAVSSLSNARIGQNSLSFANSDYAFKDAVTSLSLEWLNNISNSVSNQFVAAYTHVRDTRSSPSSTFPFIDIDNPNSGTNYMSLGYELFSYKNDVKYNTLTAYNNLTINKGIHNITAGASFQYLTFDNSYLPYGTTYYHFASLNDFVTNQAPSAFGYTYAYNGSDGYSKARYGLAGLYGQDKINVTKNLVVTAGLRIELPVYPDKLTPNPYIDTLKLLNPAGDTTHYSVNKWPKSQLLLSPRVAFNWKPLKNGRMQVRGGTGIFTGQIPFVWFTNQPGNSGTVANNVQISNTNVLKYLHFQPTASQALAQLSDSLRNVYFSSKSGNSVPGLIAIVDNNFKMPSVWRTTLATEYKIPVINVIASAEFLYTKDLVSVYQFNANLPKSTGKLVDTFGDNRPYYGSNRIYQNISGVYVLENSKNGGDSYSATFGVSKSISNGFFGSFHYTRMFAEDISPNAGSQAGSAWSATQGINSPNNLTLAPSSFYAPNRFVGVLSYHREYAKHFASTLSIVYTGSSGSRFSYAYNVDVNNDGGKYNDLMYIPKNASQLYWYPVKDLNTGATLFTTTQEIAAFNTYINQDKYLNSHRGQYAQRNGAAYPYYGRLDLKFLQDFYTIYKKRRNTLQFSIDIINFGNMLNRNWGISKTLAVPYGEMLQPHTNGGSTIKGYNLVPITNSAGQVVLPTSTFTNSISTGSVWSMQIGLRYIF